MNAHSDGPDDPRLDRYRAIEYLGERGSVTIIQDTENEDAWLQSDLVVDVTP